jgi:hypothetical protein
VELSTVLDRLDKAAANLAKVEALWARARPFIPSGPSLGSDAAYDDLARSWPELLKGLPPIDGFTIRDALPDLDEVGRAFLEYAEIGELPTGAWELAEGPAKDIEEYRWRLRRARRNAVRARLAEIADEGTNLLERIVSSMPEGSDPVEGPETLRFREIFAEIERLLGDSVTRQGRWSDLHRHLRFAQPHDWMDILELDWPSIRADIDAGALGADEPILIPMDDLGVIAASHPTGGVTTQLNWAAISDDDFERLMFDLCRGFENWENVEWLTHTNAPDRGRDISATRRFADGSGSVRSERTMVQLKHWQSRSVPPDEVSATVTKSQLWQPRFAAVVVATSGRFTADAVAWADQHNEAGSRPHVELWSESKLESLLALRPDLVAAYGLH